MKFISGILLIGFGIGGLVATGLTVVAEGSETSLKARIVQLEILLEQTTDNQKLCLAELVKATAQQRTEIFQKKMSEAAKNLGCLNGVNWNENPPICLPEVKLEKTK